MTDALKNVDVVLEGRMPKLRQEISRRTDAVMQVSSKKISVNFSSKASIQSGVKYQLGEGEVPTPNHVVIISNVGGAQRFYDSVSELAEEVERSGAYALAIAQREILNTPRAQDFVHQFGPATGLGFFAADHPEEVTFDQISSTLNQWLTYWLKLKSSQGVDHPPYLRIRQRLTNEASGRLDGSKIAELFGLSTAEMGRICGVSKQSFHANPTSKGFQIELEPLAQVARGILFCSSDEERFKVWLNQPNRDFPELEGNPLTPLDLIRMGHVQVVADKVQNLLTGHPA